MTLSSRISVVLLGIVTVWPFIYVALFLRFFFLDSPGLAPTEGLHVATIVLVIALFVFYVLHAVRNVRLSREARLKWVIALLIGHFVAFIAYWILVVWKTGATSRSDGAE